MKKHPLFEVFSGNNNSEVYFRLTSEQGDTILVSEPQANANAAYRAIDHICDPKYLEKNLHRIQTSDKQFTYHITSARQGILATGPIFKEDKSCQECMDSLLKIAPAAEIEDYS